MRKEIIKQMLADAKSAANLVAFDSGEWSINTLRTMMHRPGLNLDSKKTRLAASEGSAAAAAEAVADGAEA